MRITVNLSQIFQDHRLEAKIFIKGNMKCIKDLEDHISKLFNINHFCLKCEGHYLPPLEDVQLLRYDDVIWVTPIFTKKPSAISPESLVKTGKVDTIKRNTKKRQFDELSVDETPVKEANKECGTESKDYEVIPEEIRTLSTQDEIDKAEGCEDRERTDDTSVNTSTDLSENQLKHIWGSQRKKSEKINIIKTVLVSNKNIESPSAADCFSIANLNVSTKKATSNQSTNMQGKAITAIKNNIESYNYTSKFQTAINNSNYTSLESIGKKQKRKRYRNRKYINKVHDSTDPLKFSIYDLLTKANNSPNMNLKDASRDVHCRETEASDEIVYNETEKHIIFKEKHINEFILQQPIMQNVEPKFGDVVGFKVHKVSGQHASEISSIIIGKVVTFNPENSEVTWDIIYGQDQCFQSQDKSCVLEDVKGSNNTQFHCKWSDLLDPRLLP